MFTKRSFSVVILLTFFALLMTSSVFADDSRINRAPYHFGGDTLYCNQEEGCKLLNMTGHELASWSQDAVATALSKADQSNQKLMVGGQGQGTYGPMQLWAMPGQLENGDSTLCMVGFDEWGKQNDMCFEVTKDWHFEQAALPVVTTVIVNNVPVPVDTSCEKWSVGDWVEVIADHSKYGHIVSINLSAHTVHVTYTSNDFTAKCSEIEDGPD